MADTDIEVSDEAPAKGKKADKLAKMYKIRISSGEDAADKGDVVVAHNFKQSVIQRDVDVVVSEHIVNVLKDAVVETTVKDDKGNERQVRIPRFSFSTEAA